MKCKGMGMSIEYKRSWRSGGLGYGGGGAWRGGREETYRLFFFCLHSKTTIIFKTSIYCHANV